MAQRQAGRGRLRKALPEGMLEGGSFFVVETLVIIGVLSMAVVLRWSPEDQSLPAQADQFARILQHTQALAMGQGRSLTLDVQSATSYAITDGASATPIRDPAGEEQIYTLVNGVTLAGPDLEFDSLGRPINAGSLVSSAQNWTLTGANNTASVSVVPVTGFMTVTP